ncbi:hypothetical protein Hanom_Chr00s000007g01615701 [Helianthus anomalus]
MTPPIVPGLVIQDDEMRVEGMETDWESSEATPPQGTQYTRRDPSTSEGRDRSVGRQNPEFERMGPSGSWMTNNPSYDNLPHAPGGTSFRSLALTVWIIAMGFILYLFLL